MEAHSPSQSLSVPSLLRRAAQQHPGATCTVDVATGRQRSYRESFARANGLAAGLRRAGLTPGGRVALIALNSDRYFESFFGVPMAGGVVVPINIRLAPPEMAEQLRDGGVEFVIVDAAFQSLAATLGTASVPSIKAFVFAGEGARPAACSLGYEDLVATPVVMQDASSSSSSSSSSSGSNPRGGDDVFGIFFTGGTTGRPKGVMLTHTNVVVNALGHVAALQYTPESRYIHSAPMFHLADGASTFGVTMAGGSHVFLPKFEPLKMLAAIEAHGVNKAMMVPAMMAMMLQADPPGGDGKHDASSLRHVMYGASPMPEALLEPIRRKFANAEFVQGYGMTETSPAICMLPPECHAVGDKRMRSVGRPVPWAEVAIWGAAAEAPGGGGGGGGSGGQEVPRGTVGEIVTRGPHVMKGYYGLPEQTRAAITADGWLRTGDGGYMDEDGYVFIVDRLKDMIITGGENVYPAEVENAVAKFPGVGLCAVIGTPDAKFGEVVTAVVVPAAGTDTIDEESLVAHCRSLIAGYKVPRRIVVRKELPMSGAGKVLKNELRKEFETDALGRRQAAKARL